MFSLLAALAISMLFSPVQSVQSVQPAPSTRLSVVEFSKRSLPRSESAAAPRLPIPVRRKSAPLGVETTSKGAIVVDWLTGAPLFEKNSDEALPIASLTKLMTALVVLSGDPDWDRIIEIGADDERSGGITYLAAGERVRLDDLFNLSLVASSNGATAALARAAGLTDVEFAERMNATAARFGMSSARFVEATGLDPGNVASARDTAVLVKKALEREEIGAALRRGDYRFVAETGREHAARNTDELLLSFLADPPYRFLGGKTGFLEEARYCFGAAAQNAAGRRLIAVALGASSKENRFREVKSLLYWGFDSFVWP